jgi:hypothetical protein
MSAGVGLTRGAAIAAARGEIAVKKAFDHVGIITLEPHPGESWVEDSQVWVTNPRLHPQRIEYVRPKEMPNIPREQEGLWKLWHWPHVAYRVADLRAALAESERSHQGASQVVLGPFFPAPFVEVAFVYENGAVTEYMQYAELNHWFGQPNPPDFQHEPMSE